MRVLERVPGTLITFSFRQFGGGGKLGAFMKLLALWRD